MATTALPAVRIDQRANTVTLAGTMEWRNVQDGLFLARTVTDYTIVLPYAGSPWDPGFTDPALQPGGFATLTGPAAVQVGDPKTAAANDSATGLASALVASTPQQVAQGFPSHGLIVEPFTRIYQGGPLDGDQTFQALIGFDAAFDRITFVTVAMEVRLPVFGTDSFTTELYAGENDFPDRALFGVRVQTGTGAAETLSGSADSDEIDGAGGNDRVTGAGGDDTLAGGAGNDSLDGGAGNDSLLGGAGNDSLGGAAGNDTVTGGAGRDTATGGAGNDDFVFLATVESAGRTRDTVTDFRSGRDDIDLSAIDANGSAAGNPAFVFIGAAAFTAAGQVRFENGILSASTDGDAAAEFSLALAGLTRFAAGDLIG